MWFSHMSVYVTDLWDYLSCTYICVYVCIYLPHPHPQCVTNICHVLHLWCVGIVPT